jgi:hypothetical protein
MAKKRRPEDLVKPWATIYPNRPTGYSVDHEFIDVVELAEIIQREFNVYKKSITHFNLGSDYGLDQVLLDIRDTDPEVMSKSAESSFGRGFLLGQGMLLQLYKESPATFAALLEDVEDE